MADTTKTNRCALSPTSPEATIGHPPTHVLPNARLIGLILAALAVVLYWPVGGYGFLNYDDTIYFSSNWHVLDGLSWAGLRWAFQDTSVCNWHPLTWLSLMFDAQVFRGSPSGPHVVNVAFHAINCTLIFTLLRRLTGAIWRSATVAALFALHPLHVESVAWIAERKDVLSTLFALLALHAYVRYASCADTQDPLAAAPGQNPKKGVSETHQRSRSWTKRCGFPLFGCATKYHYYLSAAAFFILALLSKPMLVTLPVLMLLMDYWPLERMPVTDTGGRFWGRFLRRLLEKAPFFALSAASSVITLLAQRGLGAISSLGQLSAAARLENAAVSYWRYFAKLYWPFKLAVFYPHPGHWPFDKLLLAVLFLAAGCLLAFRVRRAAPYALMGWLWFLCSLTPVIGLVQFGAQAMADRFMYFPMLGLLLMTVWGINDLLGPLEIPAIWMSVPVAAILLACAVRARDQIRHWANTDALLQHAIDVTKNNNFAMALLDNKRGNDLYRSRDYRQAIECYTHSIRHCPTYAPPHNNLGLCFSAGGDFERAVQEYKLALTFDARYSNAYVNLADAFAHQGRVQEAIDAYHRVLEIDPWSLAGLNNLGAVLQRCGRFAEAASCYEHMIKLRPGVVVGYEKLASTLIDSGETDRAIRWLTQAIHLDARSPKSHFLLATALLRQGNTNRARQEIEEVIRIDPGYPGARQYGVALGLGTGTE